MTDILALAPTFTKGIVTVVASVILFIGTVYVLLTAIFGARMAYLVLAVSFFAWMILFSLIWVVGQPPVLGVQGTLPNLGPRGTEAHWQVVAAATGPVSSKFAETAVFPEPPWRPLPATKPPAALKSAADNAKSAIQKYLADRAARQFEQEGEKICDPAEPLETDCITVDPTTFAVTDFHFATSGDTSLVAAHSFFTAGGPQVTVFAYHDPGNVPVYSWSFLIASILGFVIHIPFLDRAERKRKAILTGGTAPPWFGPA
jgi:hypothetical protein